MGWIISSDSRWVIFLKSWRKLHPWLTIDNYWMRLIAVTTIRETFRLTTTYSGRSILGFDAANGSRYWFGKPAFPEIHTNNLECSWLFLFCPHVFRYRELRLPVVLASYRRDSFQCAAWIHDWIGRNFPTPTRPPGNCSHHIERPDF